MRTVIQLYLEMTLDQGGVAHVPDLPGCSFRGSDRMDLLGRASIEVSRHLDWCARHGLGDLDPQVAALIKARRKAVSASGPALVVRVAEELPGEAIWLPGAPSVLFERDREAFPDERVHAHFRVVRAAYEEMARTLSEMDREQIERKGDDGSRSIAELIDHLSRSIWWYCSRLSDALPEPGPDCPPSGLPRMQWLIPSAESTLLAIPEDKRSDIVVPTRFPTRDPGESWTLGKVCRRQAEHMVDHAGDLARRAVSAREDLLDSDSVGSHG